MNNKACPKQFLELYGKPIIIRTVEVFDSHSDVDEIVIVCLESYIDKLRELLTRFNIKKVTAVVPGGKTGQQSIYNGLVAISERNDNCIVLIHDGVRPLINQETITKNIAVARQSGGAVTTAPLVESIVRTDNSNHISQIIDRNSCVVARAPQTFWLRDIMDAHSKAQQAGRDDFIDSISIMTEYGYTAELVSGPMENIKITTPQDFYLLKALIEAKENENGWIL